MQNPVQLMSRLGWDQPDLQLVIEAWPTLPADVRNEIVALIESSAKSK